MTTLATPLRISAALRALAVLPVIACPVSAVTFGWVPAASDESDAGGYEYLVRLDAEDLEALRDGRAPSLTSELPEGIGPVTRVRIDVGATEAPRRLTQRDRQSPSRIAQTSKGAQTSDGTVRTAAKPVWPEDPEWADAKRLNRVSPTAQRRTAYQNPDALNLRGLAEGFAEGTRPVAEAGRWIDEQARNLAEGTRSTLEQGGENLRRGGENLRRGAENLLGSDSRRTDAGTNAYGQRTQYDANGYPVDDRVPPPVPTNAPAYTPSQPTEADLYAQQEWERRNTASQTQYAEQEAARRQQLYDEEERRRQAEAQRSLSSDGLAERYAADQDRFNASDRRLTPVQRNPPQQRTNQREPWNAFDDEPDRFANSARERQPTDTRRSARDPIESDWPELRAPQTGSGWDDGFTRGQSPDYTRSPDFNGGFAAGRPVTGGQAAPPATTGQTAGQAAPTGWAGGPTTPGTNQTSAAGGFAGTNAVGDPNQQLETNTVNYDRFLLVVLGAASCFTWLAYYDVRQKYRMALRDLPGGYAHSQAA